MTRTVLLDLDRTLVDLQSFTDYASAWEEVGALVEADGGMVPQTDWDRPTHACMATLVSLAGTPRWQEVSSVIAEYERRAIPSSVAMPTLQQAQEIWAGYPVAVITLLPGDVAAEVLAFHDVDIEVIIGRDPVLRPKPHGDGLLRACEMLGVRPDEATMIGDATWDLAAAADAGTSFIGVPVTPGAFPESTSVARSLHDAVLATLRA